VSLPRSSLVTVPARLPAAHHVEERSFDDDVPGVDTALEGDRPAPAGEGAAPATAATTMSDAPSRGLRSAIRPSIESSSLARSDACAAPRRTSGAGTGITESAATLGALQHSGKDVPARRAEAARISYRLRLGATPNLLRPTQAAARGRSRRGRTPVCGSRVRARSRPRRTFLRRAPGRGRAPRSALRGRPPGRA
jgi:hypothetical protein